FEPAKRLLHLGKALQVQIERHEPVHQGGVANVERVQRIVECVPRHYPKVGMGTLKRAQPDVLKLLVAPKGRQRARLLTQDICATGSGRREVEKSAIGVEYAGADPDEVSSCVSVMASVAGLRGHPAS